MKIKLLLLCSVFLYINSEEPSRHAITYILGPGRHGDHLVTYTKAKWLSYKYNIPLLFKPFKYSDKLTMHQSEKRWSKAAEGSFSKKIRIRHQQEININSEISTLFEVPFTAGLYDEFDENKLPLTDDFRIRSLFESMSQNSEFKDELEKMLTPIHGVSLIEFPENCITVALHIRTGGAFGKDKKCIPSQPLRFCKEQFYIDQLKYLSQLLDDCPIFVWVFTDDSNPNMFCERIEAGCNKPNIQFGCRTQGNHFERNVIEDMWCMSKFDCLIRPNSHFSSIAQFMGKHKIIISPYNAVKKGRNWLFGNSMISFSGNGRLCKFIINDANYEHIKEAVRLFFDMESS